MLTLKTRCKMNGNKSRGINTLSIYMTLARLPRHVILVAEETIPICI